MSVAAVQVISRSRCFLRKRNIWNFLKVRIKLGFQFMLYADFESSLKPVNDKFKEKMKQIKAEKKGEAPHAEEINMHVSSRYCG